LTESFDPDAMTPLGRVLRLDRERRETTNGILDDGMRHRLDRCRARSIEGER